MWGMGLVLFIMDSAVYDMNMMIQLFSNWTTTVFVLYWLVIYTNLISYRGAILHKLYEFYPVYVLHYDFSVGYLHKSKTFRKN